MANFGHLGQNRNMAIFGHHDQNAAVCQKSGSVVNNRQLLRYR